jgi:hypothetical protein
MAENHVLHLGKLVGNLQSLEALLRMYLQSITRKASGSPVSGKPYWNMSVGDVVPENPFTNYDSLGTLLHKFNIDIEPCDRSLKLDSSVVGIRDLLAHGRVAADAPDLTQMRIVKFDRPSSGAARVAAAALMDEKWFETNIALVRDEIERVHAAYQRFAV